MLTTNIAYAQYFIFLSCGKLFVNTEGNV